MALKFELGEGWQDQAARGLVVPQVDETSKQKFRLLRSLGFLVPTTSVFTSSPEMAEETLPLMADEMPASCPN